MATTPATPRTRPFKAHATCAWCHVDFAKVEDLIDHVDRGHLTH